MDFKVDPSIISVMVPKCLTVYEHLIFKSSDVSFVQKRNYFVWNVECLHTKPMLIWINGENVRLRSDFHMDENLNT